MTSDVLTWIETHQSLAAWVQSIGSILAIMGAIYAARKAYLGAAQQAKAVYLQIDENKKAQERKAERDTQTVSVAIFSEIHHEIVEVLRTVRSARQKLDVTRAFVDRRLQKFSVFDNDPMIIGHLEPETAGLVVNFYSQYRQQVASQQQLTRLAEGHALTDNYFDHIDNSSTKIIQIGFIVIGHLLPSSGVADADAIYESIRDILEPFVDL